MAVALGQVGGLALGVDAALDGDGIEKTLPQPPPGLLLLPGGAHAELLHRLDGPAEARGKEGLVVGAVVEHQLLPAQPGGEVGPQQGEDPVFGLDLPHQKAVQLGEADKALQVVLLGEELLEGQGHPGHIRVGQVTAYPVALVKAPADKAVKDHVPVLQTGEVGPLHPGAEFGRGLFAQALPDPPGVGGVGLHHPLRPEGHGGIVQKEELRRGLLVYITLENAGEKARKGAVVAVADLCQNHSHLLYKARQQGRFFCRSDSKNRPCCLVPNYVNYIMSILWRLDCFKPSPFTGRCVPVARVHRFDRVEDETGGTAAGRDG